MITEKTKVARALAASTVPLTRNHLADRLGMVPDNVSPYLSALKASGDIVMEPGNRWKITAKGRAYFSELNEESPRLDEEDLDRLKDIDGPGYSTIASKDIPLHPLDELAATEREDHGDFSPNQLDAISEQIAILKFDMRDTLDKAMHDWVKLMRKVAGETVAIDRKAEKVLFLEGLEMNALLRPECRAMAAYIRQDIQALEDEGQHLT